MFRFLVFNKNVIHHSRELALERLKHNELIDQVQNGKCLKYYENLWFESLYMLVTSNITHLT